MAARHDPVWFLKTETKDITDIMKAHLVELRLHDRSGAHSDSLELEIADDGTLPMPEMGKKLEVGLGYAGIGIRRRQAYCYRLLTLTRKIYDIGFEHKKNRETQVPRLKSNRRIGVPTLSGSMCTHWHTACTITYYLLAFNSYSSTTLP